MKTMTCKQLGGACEKKFQANTFEEMAELSKKHAMEMIEKSDDSHLQAMKAMTDLMKDSNAMGAWFENKRREFNGLLEMQVTTLMKKFSLDEIESLIYRFEKRQLPKTEWTHEAHILIAFWYNLKHPFEEAMKLVRKNIIAHNESVGTLNSDSEGYHESITRFWMITVSNFIKLHKTTSILDQYVLFIQSPIAASNYPLSYYSEKRLFSIEARHQWIKTDLKKLELN